MIRINSVTKKFKHREAVRDFTCELAAGCYGMLGPNGAGKTTLLHCILGLYPVTSGSVEMENGMTIGYLPQKFGLFRELKVIDMMDYFAVAKKLPKGKRTDEIMRVLDLVHLSDRAQDKAGQLSGGMQRRLGIAQAVLGDPDVLLFDEPTTGLDPEERARFKEIIRQLDRERKCIVISTHIVEDVESVCDRVIMMKDGELLEYATVAEACAFSGEEDGTLEQGYLARLNRQG